MQSLLVPKWTFRGPTDCSAAPLCALLAPERLPLSRWMPLKSVALAMRVISEAMAWYSESMIRRWSEL